MKKNSLKINYIFNLISQIVSLLVPLATTPYLARILHEEGTGKISFSNSIITWFILIANLGFVVYGQRLISANRDDEYKKSKCFWEIVFLKTIFSLVSILLLFFVINFFSDVYKKLIIILGIQIFACIFDITFYFQGVENFRIIAIRTTIIKLLGLVGVFLFVKNENDLWKYCLILSGSSLFANLSMWPSIIKKIKHVSFKELSFKKHIIPSFFLFLPTLAASIYCVFDKTMIGLLSPNADYNNGCYEQAYKINSVALILITVISPIFTSRNIYDYSKGDYFSLKEHLSFAINYTWFFSIPMIFGFLVLSDNLSSWFLGPGYDDVPILLKIMSIRFIFTGFTEIFGNQYFIAIGEEKKMVISTSISALVNVILNIFFIRLWGAIGAAISTAITEFINVFILAIYIQKEKIISLFKTFLGCWKYLLSGIIMMLLISFINNIWENNSVVSFFLLMFFGGSVYLIFLLILRDEFVLNIMKKIISKIKRIFN